MGVEASGRMLMRGEAWRVKNKPRPGNLWVNFNRRTPETSVDLLIDNGFSDVAQIRSQVIFRSQFILS